MNEETTDEKIQRVLDKAIGVGLIVIRGAKCTSPEERKVVELLLGWLREVPKAERKAKLPTDASFLKQLGIKPMRHNSASRKKGR